MNNSGIYTLCGVTESDAGLKFDWIEASSDMQFLKGLARLYSSGPYGRTVIRKPTDGTDLHVFEDGEEINPDE